MRIMPNSEDQDDIEATPEEHDAEPAVSEASCGLWRHRRFQVAAVVGVAAALGTGVFAALYVAHDNAESVAGTRVGITVGPGAAAPVPHPTGPASSSPAVGPPEVSVSAPSPIYAETPKAQAMPAVDVSETNSGSNNHTLRVVTARGDLTGQRELAWAADSGRVVGNARCTRNFRFGPGSRVGERPTMLLCWRTSAAKSVLTVAIDVGGRPSEQMSVDTINQAWSKLG
jgi:hypothetical protein